jgi:hypothetical protein
MLDASEFQQQRREPRYLAEPGLVVCVCPQRDNRARRLLLGLVEGLQPVGAVAQHGLVYDGLAAMAGSSKKPFRTLSSWSMVMMGRRATFPATSPSRNMPLEGRQLSIDGRIRGLLSLTVSNLGCDPVGGNFARPHIPEEWARKCSTASATDHATGAVGSVVRDEHCGKVAERCAHHVGADEPPAPDLAQAALEETYCVRAGRRVRAFRASATGRSASGTSVAVSSRWAMLRPKTSRTLGNVCTAASGRSVLMGEIHMPRASPCE